jgi:hypothetical protein
MHPGVYDDIAEPLATTRELLGRSQLALYAKLIVKARRTLREDRRSVTFAKTRGRASAYSASLQLDVSMVLAATSIALARMVAPQFD